jgi:hypothetical protein
MTIVVAAVSGVCLMATKATDYVGNPFLYIKFPAISLGFLNVAALKLFTGLEATQETGAVVARTGDLGCVWRVITGLLAYRDQSRPDDRILVKVMNTCAWY